jgi:hypothetical protein
MNKKPVSDIEKKVMAKIQDGQVKMRPRLYFSLFSGLSIVAVVLFGFVSSYFVSIVSLWLRIEAAMGPARGARRNLATLIDAFPWWSLILGVVSIAAMVYFVRKVGNLYKIKMVYLIAIVITVSLIFGYMFSYSNIPNTFKKHGYFVNSDSSINRLNRNNFDK